MFTTHDRDFLKKCLFQKIFQMKCNVKRMNAMNEMSEK
jgi:hypothetical protein